MIELLDKFAALLSDEQLPELQELTFMFRLHRDLHEGDIFSVAPGGGATLSKVDLPPPP